MVGELNTQSRGWEQGAHDHCLEVKVLRVCYFLEDVAGRLWVVVMVGEAPGEDPQGSVGAVCRSESVTDCEKASLPPS